MREKISYRAVPIERVTGALLAALLAGTTKLVVVIDVAKTKMMAGFGREDGGIVRLVRFEAPAQSRAFVELITATAAALGVAVDALMEPTGTYGDALRELLIACGARVHMLSAKRVHDAREVFDGVPSLHDAKSCVVMAQLHRQGVSRPYVVARDDQVRLRAMVHRREIYETPLQMLLGDLESRLARHWPELLVDMDVWRRKTPLELLALYPCPTEVVAHWDDAREVMRRASRNTMKEDEARRVLDSATSSIGMRMLEEERDVVRTLAREALHLRAALSSIDKEIEKVASEHEATRGIATVVGRVTAAVLVGYLGPLSAYSSAAALEKACGLNLKVKSSGNLVGRPSITRRGPPEVRAYLHLAALRLVKDDELVARWYRARGGHREGRKLIALVAVTRKLIRALWHVARGERFDSTKLIDARALPAELTASRDAASQQACVAS